MIDILGHGPLWSRNGVSNKRNFKDGNNFYVFGIIVSMICEAGCKHSKPHVHVWYQGHQASFDIATGTILAQGKDGFPERQAGWVKTWIELHQDELFANWEIALRGGEVYKINPLQK